jgi:hypothetical protein
MAFYFTLAKGDFSRLDWGHVARDGTPPELTNEQATIALQLHQALGPLREIADRLKKQ